MAFFWNKIIAFKSQKNLFTMKKILFITLTMMSLNAMAQNMMSPEILWKLGRVTSLGVSKDGKNVVYTVSTPSIEENKSDSFILFL